MRSYLRRNMPPLLWEALFCLSMFLFEDKMLWTTLVFYLGLIVYFGIRGDISFTGFGHHLMSGGRFWICVAVTFGALGVAYMAAFALGMAFPSLDDGLSAAQPGNGLELAVYAVETILLAPVAEEAFFRQSLMDFGLSTSDDASASHNRWAYAAMLILSIVLSALGHTLMPFGIAMVALWGLALALVYMRFRDVYALMVGHFACNLIYNGVTVVFLLFMFVA